MQYKLNQVFGRLLKLVSFKMNGFLSPIKSSASPSETLSEREKQKRIHTWLGEQTTDYLKPPFSTRSHIPVPANFGDVQKFQNGMQAKTNLSNGSHVLQKSNEEISVLKSQSALVCPSSQHNEKKRLQKQKVSKSGSKEKRFSGVVFQSNVFPKFDRQHSAAAVKIQALWRGYYTRSKNQRVVEIRHEIRARRTEQYITTLCNEISMLKQKQKADRKLRELQTEAIRFMWTQIREMQQKHDAKVTELEEKLAAVKTADDVTFHSSYSKDNINLNDEEHKEELKNTVEKLQTQVIQLQDALLSFSDRLVAENDVVALSIQEDGGDDAAKEEALEDEDQEEDDVVNENFSQSFAISVNEDDEVLSARDNVPKITVQNVLESLDSSLTEKELWSFCEQSMLALKTKKAFKIKFLSPTTVYIRKDGLVSFSDSNLLIDTTYSAPELSDEDKTTSLKSLIFSLAVTMWTAADFNMTEDQAPCLSTEFENLLIKMSQDKLSERADIDDVLKTCAEHHSSTNCNSLQVCSSLYAETSDMKKGKKRQIKSVSFSELFSKEITKTRSEFQTSVVPQINTFSFKLKAAAERQLSPKPKDHKTPYEQLLDEIKRGITLKEQPEPILYTVQDMFRDNPELIQKLNILPGQRRKNVMAVKAAIKKLSSAQGRQVLPTPPQSLKAEIRANSHQDSSSKSLILRWHPSYIYDKHGSKVKSESIIGYRIYVNRQPKGMVNGVKCRALLDGLKRAGEYRIHICAVSALGESEPSNTVVANLESGFMSMVSGSPSVSFSSPISKMTPEPTSPSLPSPQSKPSGNQSGDVVERVLQRYGIKKTELSQPLSSTKRAKSPKKHLKLPPNIGFHQHGIPTRTLHENPAMPEISHIGNGYAASTSSSEDHITPRTKALLDQLKHELLG